MRESLVDFIGMWDEKNILGEQRVDFKGGKTNFFFGVGEINFGWGKIPKFICASREKFLL